MNDLLKDLEQKPTTPGPWRKMVGSYGIRWCSLTVGWHNEPWSMAKWRLAQITKPALLKKAKAIEGRIKGCLLAGAASNFLPMDSILAVGFGGVNVRVGKISLWGGDNTDYRVARVETLAATRPELDWRIEFSAPMSGTTYQRVGPRRWALIAQNRGFA